MVRAALFFVALCCAWPASAQTSPSHPLAQKLQEPLPTAKLPTARVPFDCYGGNRTMFMQSLSIEVGDSLTGQLATPRICGSCFFSNAPGSPPDYQHPINLKVTWGDGQSDQANVTSDHLDGGGPITFDRPGISGNHVYNTEINPPVPYSINMSALCINTQGQWLESVENDCKNTGWPCTPSIVTIGVYKSEPISSATIARDVVHGKIATGALAVNLQTNAPPSGTKIVLLSSNGKVLFPQPGKPSTKTSTVLIPPTQQSANFDIDATKATVGTSFTISVSNPGTPSPVVTLNYTVK
jgi:hypothetical protein